MKCPIDETELVMSERKGVEIDYCPKCRGVWLDRGELDKILERAAAAEVPRAEYDRGSRYGGKPKRHSWLSEIFD
jgi:Zn-finger nucleic acid-binding protein